MPILFTYFAILLINTSRIEAYNVQKCGACEVVAVELSTRLANERPRNHLDARHRLDAEGKRYGKVIDFAISELRVIELVEDLCTEMDKYQLDNQDSRQELDGSNDNEPKQRWILSSEAPPAPAADGEESSSGNSEQLIKEQRRVLKNTCADIVGDLEDDIAEAITSGTADAENIRDVLCIDLGKYCPVERMMTTGEGEGSHRRKDEL